MVVAASSAIRYEDKMAEKSNKISNSNTSIIISQEHVQKIDSSYAIMREIWMRDTGNYNSCVERRGLGRTITTREGELGDIILYYPGI
jgi:hypothetical protein